MKQQHLNELKQKISERVTTFCSLGIYAGNFLNAKDGFITPTENKDRKEEGLNLENAWALNKREALT